MKRACEGNQYDIVIIGGGLVGASLAIALQPLGISVAVIEAVAGDDVHNVQPSFDDRTIALTYNARQIYTDMGIWQAIAAQQAHPIREIHISDRGHFGMTHLRHSDIGTEALGYVVPSRVMGKVLYQRMRQSTTLSVLAPATVENLISHSSGYKIVISRNHQTLNLNARLVVVADGGRSCATEQLGIFSKPSRYRQSAIVCTVATNCEHHARAYERFTHEGPIALLPNGDKRFALVWTTEHEHVTMRMDLSDAKFVEALGCAFGSRAGIFSHPSPRKCYPLQHGKIDCPIARRAVLIGNAAHSIHPVAGQGFNLGLRDVTVLKTVIQQAIMNGQDIADPVILQRYVELRRSETAMVSGFTDGLIRLFGSRRKSVRLARNIALMGIEACPLAKRLLLKRTMGMARAIESLAQ